MNLPNDIAQHVHASFARQYTMATFNAALQGTMLTVFGVRLTHFHNH